MSLRYEIIIHTFQGDYKFYETHGNVLELGIENLVRHRVEKDWEVTNDVTVNIYNGRGDHVHNLIYNLDDLLNYDL